MDVAAIVLTASSIIAILQVVSIVLIVKNKKTVVKTEPIPVQPAQPVSDQRDFRKRRDENRFSRKPGFEPRQKPVAPQQPQAVDYVEKSLRDINLKLKNAERDQEDARKKIRDDIQSPQSNQNPPRRFDNNQERPNRGRDDDFRRRDRNGRPNSNFRDRDQNRDQNRDRDQNRGQGQNRAQSFDRPQVEKPQAPLPQPSDVIANPSVVAPNIAPKAVGPVNPPPVIEKEDLVAVPENTEILHGRKVLVRRRILTPEEQAAKDRETAGAGSAAPAAAGDAAPQSPSIENKPAEAQTNQQPENESDAFPVRFGR